jgi:hypothetical protein
VSVEDWSNWTGGGSGDKWKPSENVGKIVRLRMKSRKDLTTKFGEWSFIETDVDQVEGPDAYTAMTDVPISGRWFLGTFTDHLPYTALGVVEAFEGEKGTGYRLRKCSEEEKALALKALDLPEF